MLVDRPTLQPLIFMIYLLVFFRPARKIGFCKIQAYEAAARQDRYRAHFDTLTAREKEVVVLAAKGKTNKEIAEVLGIGAETVKMHKANAYGKLNVQSALEAYQWLEKHPVNVLHGKEPK